MEQRLEVREGKLVKAVERAESDGRKYEAAAAAHAVSTTMSGWKFATSINGHVQVRITICLPMIFLPF